MKHVVYYLKRLAEASLVPSASGLSTYWGYGRARFISPFLSDVQKKSELGFPRWHKHSLTIGRLWGGSLIISPIKPVLLFITNKVIGSEMWTQVSHHRGECPTTRIYSQFQSLSLAQWVFIVILNDYTWRQNMALEKECIVNFGTRL